MDAKEAIEILSDGTKDWKEIFSAIAAAVGALKKQIPQKPIDIKGMNHKGACPVCKSILDSRYTYCGDCGQMLEWKGKKQK